VELGPLARLRTLRNFLGAVSFPSRCVLACLRKRGTVPAVLFGWPVRNLLLDGLLPVARVRVTTKEFGWRLSALALHRFEKICHALRVIAGLVEDHCAHCVSLRFVAARVVHH